MGVWGVRCACACVCVCFFLFHCVVALTMGDAAEVQGDRGFP